MEAAVKTSRRGRSQGERLRLAPARSRLSLAALGGLFVLLLGLALRVLRLDFQPLWWDEGYSAWFATHSIPQMVALTAEDIHPPLYYALLHLWTRVAGPGPVSLRLLSVAFGVAAIPVIYVAAHRILGGRRPALLAALLLAVNPLHVYYSQEVRMYGLVALLSAGVLWAAWRVFCSRETRFLKETWFLAAPYVLFTTLALYTQYYAVFLPVGLTLYALWRWRRDATRLLRWFALQAVVALLYLPWAVYALPRLTLYVSQKVIQDADRPLGLVPYLARHGAAFVAGHLEGPLAPWWPVALLLLIPLVAGLILAHKRDRREPDASYGHIEASQSLLFLGIVLTTALLLGWLISLRFPFFPERGERLLLLALPAFILLAAVAIEGLFAGSLRLLRLQPRSTSGGAPPLRMPLLRGIAGPVTLAAFVLIAGVSLITFYTTPRYTGDDYRPLIARTVEQGLPEDTVFCVYPWQAGYWRSYAAGVDGPVTTLTPSVTWGMEVEQALDVALARGHVWFPAHLALGGMLEERIERHLAERGVAFANTWYGPGTRLSAWAVAPPATSAAPASGPTTLPLPAGTPLELTSVRVGNTTAPAANAVVPLVLSWRASTEPPAISVSVRLTDDLGQIWGQNDYEPLGRMIGSAGGEVNGGAWQSTDRLGVLIPTGAPPGRYKLELVATLKGREDTIIAPEGAEWGRSSAVLGTLEVTLAARPLSPARLPVAERQELPLDNGLRFLGSTVDHGPLAPGDLVRANLFWGTDRTPTDDYTAFVQMLGADGAPVAGWEAPPGAAYSTSRWRPGTLIRTQASFRPPATLADGRYRLIAGLYRMGDGVRAKTKGGEDAVSLGFATIKGRPRVMKPPSPAYSADATFGSVAVLVGYTLPLREVPPAPGETIPLTLHWQALGATDRPYTVFVHLVDAAGQVWGNGDAEPGAAQYPTTGWLEGEYIEDEHQVAIAPNAPPGQYRLRVGFYDPVTGERLTTATGEAGYILGEAVTVR